MKILYYLSLIMTILYILAFPLCALGVPGSNTAYAKGWKLIFFTTIFYPGLWWNLFFMGRSSSLSLLGRLFSHYSVNIQLLQIILMFVAIIITVIGFLIMD